MDPIYQAFFKVPICTPANYFQYILHVVLFAVINHELEAISFVCRGDDIILFVDQAAGFVCQGEKTKPLLF